MGTITLERLPKSWPEGWPGSDKRGFLIKFRGRAIGEASFNLDGYSSPLIPTPTGNEYIGEISLAALRKTIARINREWKAHEERGRARCSPPSPTSTEASSPAQAPR